MDLATRLIHHRRAIIAFWLVLIVLGFGAAYTQSGRMAAVTRLEGSESAHVEDVLAERFGAETAQSLLLVARGLDAAPAFERLTDEIAAVRGVRGVTSPATVRDPLLRGSEDGSAIFVVGVDTRAAPADSMLAQLRGVSTRAAAELRDASPGATLRWTGGVALSSDLRHTSAHHSRRAELRALPLLLVVLLLAFRSVVAALIPLVLGAVAIVVGLGAALAISWFGTPSTLLGNVASILGLALGIDYSLLMVTRFREALAGGGNAVHAASAAVRGAGHTIVMSGSTVALGFAGLLLVPIPEIRSVGLGGLGVAAVAVALATTLLPAVLAALGTGIDRGRFGPAPRPVPSKLWYALGSFVTARPATVLLAAGAPLVLLALPAMRLSSATPQQEWLPARMESTRALADLAAIGRGGLASVIPIVIALPAADGAERWRPVMELSAALARDERVGEVRSVATLAAAVGVSDDLFVELAPDAVRRHFVSEDGSLARIDVVPAAEVPGSELAALVRWIRALAPMPDARGSGAPTAYAPLVGGLAAFQVDFEAAVARAFPWVVASVIGSILLALSIGFRSLLIPLKATLLNLLTVGAAFGALVLVFQDGHGSALFGVAAPLTGVFPGVPILAFCIVFGLSMDYEVFLVGRIAEARRAAGRPDERTAIIEGLARTGRVITFAAALMVIVFTSFSFGEYLPAALLGFALAVAVLADVTLVRLAVGPALLQLAGRWNWWPGDGRAPRAARAPAGDVAIAHASTGAWSGDAADSSEPAADETVAPRSGGAT